MPTMASETLESELKKKNINVGVLSRILTATELKKLLKNYDEAPRLWGYGSRGPRALTNEEVKMFDRHLNFKGPMSEFADAEGLKRSTIASRLYRIAYLIHIKKAQE